MKPHQMTTTKPQELDMPLVIQLQRSSAYWSAIAHRDTTRDYMRTFAQGMAAEHHERMWVHLSAMLGVEP